MGAESRTEATARVAGLASGTCAGQGARHTGGVSLHCPATLYIARHGDAEYTHAHVMSDEGGWLTETGQIQVTECAHDLADRRIAAVYSSPMQRAVESGVLASGELSVRHRALAGLEEIRVGERAGQPWSDPVTREVYDAWFRGDLDARIPGGESGAEVVARFREALATIVDQHRGEQVLIFTHGGIMSLVVPRLAINVRDDLAYLQFVPNAVPARVEAGDEDWRVISWPGSASKDVV